MSTKRQVFYIDTPQFSLCSCLFAAPQNPSKTLVILSHGFAYCSNMAEHARLFIEMAENLTSVSADALLFDFEGHGLSSGSFKDTSPLQRIENLSTVIAWAEERYSHVILLGFSMGAAASIYAAHSNKVDGLITWNAVPTLSLTAPSATWFFHDPDQASSEHHGTSWVTDRPTRDIGDIYPEIACPKLHIQGTADYPGFEAEFAPIFERALSPKMKVMIEGANHPFVLHDHRDQLYRATSAWVKERITQLET